jgi:glycosyltransferase involved in cell wall biosynthesis
MPRTPELVSVIVPSYNAGPGLFEQLCALDRQDYGGAYELILVDNGSRDGSADAARRWAAGRPRAKVVESAAPRGPGAARNAGVRVASGDLLAFCDADDVASPGWLRLMVVSASGADVVAGALDTTALNSVGITECFSVNNPHIPHLDFLPVAAGSNLAIWREVLLALGGFEERSKTGEDVALTWKAHLAGYTFSPSDAVVHKRLPRRPLEGARRFFRYGIGDAWLYSEFRSAGMGRRNRRSTWNIWKQVALGFPAAPPLVRRRRWLAMAGLCLGRLVGSVRYRVLFP